MARKARLSPSMSSGPAGRPSSRSIWATVGRRRRGDDGDEAGDASRDPRAPRDDPPRRGGRATRGARRRRERRRRNPGSAAMPGWRGWSRNPIRSVPGIRTHLRREGPRRVRRDVRIAGLVPGDAVEHRRGVPHRSGRRRRRSVAPIQLLADRRVRDPARGSASGPPGRTRWPGRGSIHRRRWRGRPAPCRPPPRRRSRRTTRRSSGRGSTGCGWGRRPGARW